MDSSSRSRRARSQTSVAPRWKVRLLDFGIVLAALLICIFVFSFSTRLSYSRPQVREAPEIVRVQILNGSGHPGLARRVADRMAQLAVGRMRFDMIDVGNSDRTDVKRSLVINRRLKTDQLRDILAQLNVGDVEVVDGTQRANDLGVDLTLLLGKNATEPPKPTPSKTDSKNDRP